MKVTVGTFRKRLLDPLINPAVPTKTQRNQLPPNTVPYGTRWIQEILTLPRIERVPRLRYLKFLRAVPQNNGCI